MQLFSGLRATVTAAALVSGVILAGVPAGAQTDATAAQQAAIAPIAKQYFTSVASANLKGIEQVTTPDFRLTTQQGEALTPSQIIARVKDLRFAYGNVATSGQGVTSRTNASGNRVTAIVTLQVAAHGLAPEGSGGGGHEMRNTVHRLVWVNGANGWKLASDRIQSSNLVKTTY